MNRLHLTSLAATLALALSVSAASAQTPTAQAFVEQRQSTAQQLLRRPAGEARNRELQRVFDDMLDYEELARRSLSRHWAQRSREEQTQFVALLKQLVERAYQDNLQRTLQFEVRVVSTEGSGDATVVRTEARSRTNRRTPPVQVDYSLRSVGGRWRVFDIHTDGVSLVSNYRSQFNRIITREGWAGLIGRMQQRAAAGASDI